MKPIKLEDLEEENSYIISNQQQYPTLSPPNISQMMNAPLASMASLAQSQIKNVNYPPLQHISNFKYEPNKERDTETPLSLR